MSFIDVDRSLAFVHVSKTSSIIEWTWRNYCGVKTEIHESRLYRKNLWVGGAHDCAQYMDQAVPELWNRSFKVGFVRNPWAWWLSAYYWYNPPRHKGFDFLMRFPTFHDFMLRWREWRPEFPWCGYTGFLCDPFDHIMVDYVGHSERLQEDFDLICDRVDFPRTTLPTKTDRRHYRDYYDEEMKGIVAKHLSPRDISVFGLMYDDGGDC